MILLTHSPINFVFKQQNQIHAAPRNLTLIHNLQFPLRKLPVPLSKIQCVQSSKGCIFYCAVFQIIFHMTKIRSQIILLLSINRFWQTVAILITAGGAVTAPCRGNEGRRWWQRQFRGLSKSSSHTHTKEKKRKSNELNLHFHTTYHRPCATHDETLSGIAHLIFCKKKKEKKKQLRKRKS